MTDTKSLKQVIEERIAENKHLGDQFSSAVDAYLCEILDELDKRLVLIKMVRDAAKANAESSMNFPSNGSHARMDFANEVLGLFGQPDKK